jgi:23S rRNA pseudouridine1911/1915/1917 synthase
MTALHFIISESEAGQRLDSTLAAVAGITRSQARRWIDADRVRVNDRSCRASQSVRAGDDLDVTPPDLAKSALEPEAIALDVLYEDEDLIVIDKPAGMVVHPAPGHSSGTLVHALLHHCGNLAGIGGVERPGIVHRLDRGTSGVLVAAKCDEAHRHLAEQFHEHTIERVYRAVVRGAPSADEGRVDRAIGRRLSGV